MTRMPLYPRIANLRRPKLSEAGKHVSGKGFCRGKKCTRETQKSANRTVLPLFTQSRKGDTFLFAGASVTAILGEPPRQGRQPARICSRVNMPHGHLDSARLLPICLESIGRRRTMLRPPPLDRSRGMPSPYSIRTACTEHGFLAQTLDPRSRSTALTRLSPFGSTTMPLAPDWSVRAGPKGKRIS